MAHLIQGGSRAFDYLAYGEPHPSTVQFIQNQLYEHTPAVSDATNNFFSRAYDLFDDLSSSSAVRMARAAKRAINNIWDDDSIKPLTDISQMQWAHPQMQRWIMAEPYVRQRYHDQNLEGYEGSYVDNFENDIGETHYDYRRVVDGILREEDDGNYYATTYFEDLYEGDRGLEIDEQSDILLTWLAVKNKVLEENEDPTSRWNASL